MVVIGNIAFAVLGVVVVAFGALQRFSPRTLRQLQKQFRPKADWSASAGGKFFEDLADRQASDPSVSYRLAGLLVMAIGLCMLSVAVARLLR